MLDVRVCRQACKLENLFLALTDFDDEIYLPRELQLYPISSDNPKSHFVS